MCGMRLSPLGLPVLVGPLVKVVPAVLLPLWWRALRATPQPPGGILATLRDVAPVVPWWEPLLLVPLCYSRPYESRGLGVKVGGDQARTVVTSEGVGRGIFITRRELCGAAPRKPPPSVGFAQSRAALP